ncbi:GDP dissociation inhibitor-domain-containing protein [Parasitella parasitica]|nr:GDP dissociation inhibitor-domain-containing protein [Parasitella parasitica]
MADNLEETSFDYIVLGTGLIESILAGSLARIGRKVLHLDSHQNYGGNWSVFGFRELVQWYLDRNKDNREKPKEGDLSIDYEHNYASNFKNVDLKIYNTKLANAEINHNESTINQDKYKELIPKTSFPQDQELVDAYFSDLTPENLAEKLPEITVFVKLLNKSRSYNLDTTPKLLGAREDLVETLIQSGVGRYLEFKNVDGIFIFDQTSRALEKVPSSKEDVFTNKSVTLIDKRKLMKFLTFAMETNEECDDPLLENTEEMTYSQFLQEKFKITGKLQEAIIYAIALVNEKASVKEGLRRTHRFVLSMGRFGKGAYLCPLYGGGSEIAQAFCRVCAVYGGIYILNQPLDRFVVDKETGECEGIITKEGQEYKCKKLIAGIDYLNASFLPSKDEQTGTWISRAMLVTESAEAKQHIAEALSYLVFPPGSEAGNTDEPIYGIQQNDESMACLKGQYVTYLWTASKNDSVLKKAVDLLMEKKPASTDDENNTQQSEKLITVFYDQYVRNSKALQESSVSNIVVCSDPDISMDFRSAFEEAKNLFYQCESIDTEFMPAADQQAEDDD